MHLAFWAVALAVGIGCAIDACDGGWLVCCVVVACAAAVAGHVVRERRWRHLLAFVSLGLGIGLGAHDVARARGSLPIEEDRLVEVLGWVLRGADISGEPAVSQAGAPGGQEETPQATPTSRCHLWVRVESVDGRRMAATASLLVLNGVPAIAPGTCIRFASRLYLPRGFANPGLPDSRLLARAQGLDLLAAVKSPSDLRQVEGGIDFVSYLRRLAFRLRQGMATTINGRLSEPAAGFVRTMVIGERTNVPTSVEDGFRAAGATHVLSVSGLHLAVVAALVFQVLQRLLSRFPSWSLRIPPKALASALSLPAVGFYTMLTGEAVATVRSALMATIVLGAAVVNRPVSLAASIAAAAVVLLVSSPLALLDVSFQLSFASVIGLGLFARWLVGQRPEWQGGRFRRALKWLLGSLSASFAASLVTSPLVAHHFGEITPVAPVGNLVLVPLVELVVLPCGLVGALLALAHPWLGALPLWAAGFVSQLALALAELFRRFAPVVLVRFPNWFETLFSMAAAAALLQAFAGGRTRRKRWLVLGAVAASVAGGSLLGRDVMRRSRDDLRITFIDVGQGDAALIEGPLGFVALIDGGGRYDNAFDTGARIVEPVLRALGITKLDLVVLSHPHPDHMNGLFRVLRRFDVRALWTQGSDGGNPAYRDLIRTAQERGISMPLPGSFSTRGLSVDVLGPWDGNTIGVPTGLDANDASLIVRFGYGGRRVLFVGDIGIDGESELLQGRSAPADPSCDVLKIPHHGSRNSSSRAFLDAVSPVLAVASAGKYNRFHLPNPAALARYADKNVRVLRTDRDGAVRISVDRTGQTYLDCMRGCRP